MARPSRGRRPADVLFARLGHLCVWALVLAAPFAVAVTADDAFRLPKLLLAEWLGLASLLAYSLAAAVRSDVRAQAPPWWRHPAVLATAPVLGVAGLGLVTSDHPAHTRQALADLWIGGACLVGWSLALPAERLGRFLRGTVVPAGLMSLLAVLQFHDLFRPFRFSRGEEAFRTGLTSLAGNAGDLGAYLVLPALAAQWGLVRSLGRGRGRGRDRPGRRRLRIGPWSVVLAACVYGLAVSQSLTPVAALLAGTALFWLAALSLRRALVSAAVVAVLAGILLATVPPLRERVATVGGLVARGQVNAALTGRLDGWRTALWMLQEHPWTGVGHGAYRTEFAEAKLELQERGVEFYPAHTEPFFANAHNDFLEAAAEWGLPGVVALLWGLGVLGRSLVSGGSPAPGSGQRWSRAFTWGGTASAGVLALGHFPFHLALVGYPYLLFLAWAFRRAAPGEGDG